MNEPNGLSRARAHVNKLEFPYVFVCMCVYLWCIWNGREIIGTNRPKALSVRITNMYINIQTLMYNAFVRRRTRGGNCVTVADMAGRPCPTRFLAFYAGGEKFSNFQQSTAHSRGPKCLVQDRPVWTRRITTKFIVSDSEQTRPSVPNAVEYTGF